MGKIRDLVKVKEYLVCGQMKCSDVWAVDGQEKLKGNTLKAFERDLETICSFSKSTIGRSSYYHIEEIFAVAKEKFHGNKISMVGNTNKVNKLTYAQGSDSEFIAAVIINKLEYFEKNKDESYKTVGMYSNYFGFKSEDKKINTLIKQNVERNLVKLHKLGLIELNVQYHAVVKENFINITEEEYKKHNKKSKEVFREVVGDMKADYYKCFYRFIEEYDWQDKEDLLNVYRTLMETNVEYVFKTYKAKMIDNTLRIYNPVYKRLSEVLYNGELNGKSIGDQINKFIEKLEKKNEVETND